MNKSFFFINIKTQKIYFKIERKSTFCIINKKFKNVICL